MQAIKKFNQLCYKVYTTTGEDLNIGFRKSHKKDVAVIELFKQVSQDRRETIAKVRMPVVKLKKSFSNLIAFDQQSTYQTSSKRIDFIKFNNEYLGIKAIEYNGGAFQAYFKMDSSNFDEIREFLDFFNKG